MDWEGAVSGGTCLLLVNCRNRSAPTDSGDTQLTAVVVQSLGLIILLPFGEPINAEYILGNMS